MAKARVPAPIDRPLSKAYLREFGGWSTAYPPGVSDPSTLRVMHNCSVDADGALRIRPGMRKVLSVPTQGDIVGDIENFYTADGRPAILYGIREGTSPNRVLFRTAVYSSTTHEYVQDALTSTRFPGYTDSATAFTSDCTYVTYVQIDNKILALPNNGQPFRMFWVGSSPKVKVITGINKTYLNRESAPRAWQPVASWIAGPQTTHPNPETLTTTTLAHSDPTKNTYNLAYFYSFNNEIGETEVSQAVQVRVQRPWAAWDTGGLQDHLAPDQIVVSIPNGGVWNGVTMNSVYDEALAAGAVSWNLYMLRWSDQEAVPVEAQLIKTVDMYDSAGTARTWTRAGWAQHTPLLQGSDSLHPLPSVNNRDNSTIPARAARGLVAGDRLVLVYNQQNRARIVWSSNQQGEYLNFSPSRGGGYKTLTSGNLSLPVTAKLWQNPSSVDTVTILCAGMHGGGTSYYMTPGTTTSTQSQASVIMGFEETTATAGTASPHAVEVLNNALYHPLENNLVKSTASNYNISHKPMADPIQNVWTRVPLADKRRMVSSQMDTYLYYLVRSPLAWDKADPSNGTQIWTCDTAREGLWSCWDVPGTSLRRLEIEGLLYMAVVAGKNIFVMDPEYDHDDVWNGTEWVERGIKWEAVTNTQGANRAHDAWAFLQQVNVTFGNFIGECVYGVRGKDVHGQPVEVLKHFRSDGTRDPLQRFDQGDFLLVQRTMKEWEFFWRSADRPRNRSHGSISHVQYRYTPSSVNSEYAYGSVETFEYGSRADAHSNGTPFPFADVQRP